MKPLKIITITLIITACHSTKKSTSVTTSEPSVSVAPPPTASVSGPAFRKPADGIYPPGNEELNAIKIQYADLTLEKLKEGHLLYTQGACINCHAAQNIYTYGETQWKQIMDNMALKARITEAQKDAVYKYVLAIKAAKQNWDK